MIVKIKKLHADAVLPKYAQSTDAGMDLVATSKEYDEHGNAVYGCGLAMEIPKGYVGLLFPRSSNSKMELSLTNAVGVIDSGYRGEVMAKFRCTRRLSSLPKLYQRIGYFLFNFKFLTWFFGSESATTCVSIIHDKKHEYQIGDRFAQLIIMPYPEVEFEEADELSDSDRGSGGYGSSGK